MTKRKVSSRRYDRLMAKSWEKRHTKRNQKRYGVWRWRGMYEYRGIIVSILEGARVIIDYGGALGPLGFDSGIIDVAEKGINGQRVFSPRMLRKGDMHITEWPPQLTPLFGHTDVVFSSHTLEHVDNLAHVLADLKGLLRTGGTLILHLPSDRNAKHWHPAATDKHKRLFTLVDKQDPAYVRIDKVIGEFFDIDICDYCGDSSIMLIARKR